MSWDRRFDGLAVTSDSFLVGVKGLESLLLDSVRVFGGAGGWDAPTEMEQ
jgi:hypothetical protein